MIITELSPTVNGTGIPSETGSVAESLLTAVFQTQERCLNPKVYRLSRIAGNGSFKFTNTDTVIEATRTSVPTGATPVRPWNAYGNTRGDSDWIAVRQILAVPPTIGTATDV